MAKKSQKLKICSRGHQYKGLRPCPVCWPGGAISRNKIRSEKKKFQAKI